MNIDMTRHSGAIGIPVAECIDSRFGIWRVRTDIQPVKDEESGQQTGVSFIEIEFPYKPSMDEVKEFVLGVINAQTDDKILTGYQWKVLHGDDEGLVANVWLSTENQTNYKAKHDAALQYPQLTEFPMQYKIGEYEERQQDEEGHVYETKKRPVYEYFANIQELAQFYLGGVAFIESCCKEGWAKKDSFDFTPYEEALNPAE